jgi:hypothetical protein
MAAVRPWANLPSLGCEERQPTAHGFRERLRNFAFKVAAGLVRAGKLAILRASGRPRSGSMANFRQ